MEIKRLTTQVDYRIEAKPEGGFIARATDPAAPSLEAPTREELQQKIRAQAVATLATQFPGLRLVLESQLKAGGLMQGKGADTSIIRSTGSGSEVIQHATPEQIAEFVQQVGGFLGKNFPDIAKSLAAGAEPVGLPTNVVVNTSVQLGSARVPAVSMQDSVALTSEEAVGTRAGNVLSEGSGVANIPITPEATGRWPFFLAALALVSAVLYFLFRH